jgi:tripartite-type tricarboxylate transporter receptor subunit TctC
VALFGPAGLPKPIVDKLNAQIRKGLTSRDNRLDAFEPWYMTPEQTAARVKSDYEKYGRLMKMVGVEPK